MFQCIIDCAGWKYLQEAFAQQMVVSSGCSSLKQSLTDSLNCNVNIVNQFQDLATKYASSLNVNQELVIQALHELQLHSIDKLRANEEFKETGCATLRVRATVPGEKPRIMKILKQLTVRGEELVESLAELLGVVTNRYIALSYFDDFPDCIFMHS